MAGVVPALLVIPVLVMEDRATTPELRLYRDRRQPILRGAANAESRHDGDLGAGEIEQPWRIFGAIDRPRSDLTEPSLQL